jgi:hypothetical protein
MAMTNQERVGKAMDFLRAGLAPFVEREVQSAVKAGTMRVDAVRRFADDPLLGNSARSHRNGKQPHAEVRQPRLRDGVRPIEGFGLPCSRERPALLALRDPIAAIFLTGSQAMIFIRVDLLSLCGGKARFPDNSLFG